ncbi:MAG TPA: signal peptidase I [Mycobacteriales bacterium]|nr:signal peptidase I [Mycobacteriales bacterium]
MTDDASAEPGIAADPDPPTSHQPSRPAPAPAGQPESVSPSSVDGKPGGRRKTTARQRGTSFWRELPILLLIALVLAVLIKTFLVQAFFIPSGSMERTLHGCPGCSGDRVLVNKLVYRFRDPHPGDIVVFRGPESWAPEVLVAEPSNVVQRGLRAVGQVIGLAQPSEKDFIKRVVAVGGQTVLCCDAQGRITVDGRALTEPYIYTDGPQDPKLSQFGPVTVPPGRLWVMGDHRNASADSRAHITDENRGTIAVGDVIGKAFVIAWPPSRWDTLGSSATLGAAGRLTAPDPVLLSLGAVVPFGVWRRRRRGRISRAATWVGPARSGRRRAGRRTLPYTDPPA